VQIKSTHFGVFGFQGQSQFTLGYEIANFFNLSLAKLHAMYQQIATFG
jgi:hypothetical protein